MKKEKKGSHIRNAETEQTHHEIEIVKVSIGSGKNPLVKSYVIPGTVHVSPGDTVTWWSDTTTADFFFPNPNIFKEEKDQEQLKGVKKLTVTIGETEEREKRHPYAVFTDNNDFAEGGSFPVLIVK